MKGFKKRKITKNFVGEKKRTPALSIERMLQCSDVCAEPWAKGSRECAPPHHACKRPVQGQQEHSAVQAERASGVWGSWLMLVPSIHGEYSVASPLFHPYLQAREFHQWPVRG